MKLALFDLDNTLIAGDSDCLWGEFLCEQNYVDCQEYTEGHERFYQDYLKGELNIDAFLKFQLGPLSSQPLDTLISWRQNYLQDKIQPILLDPARDLIEKHRQQDHCLMIITATNRFLTEPIAELLKVTHLIACEPEIKDGQYTGNYIGTPSYQAGKVTRLNEWLAKLAEPLEESWFYSDSHNDIPLLEFVDHPIAVDPDDALRKKANDQGWPIISLR